MGARAARLRLAAPPRGGAIAARPARWPAAGRRMDRGNRRRRRPRLGARCRRPPRRLLAVARRRCCSMAPTTGATRAVMRSLAEQVTYLSASWRNAPDGYPRLLALIALVCADLCIADHERQLAQSVEAAGRRAGAPDPARRRPHRPQPRASRRAAARPAAAAPMLRARAASEPDRRIARGHRPHGGDAAPPAAGRRHCSPASTAWAHRARCARHGAGLRRGSGPQADPRRPRAMCASARGDRGGRRCRRAAADWSWRAAPARAACPSR